MSENSSMFLTKSIKIYGLTKKLYDVFCDFSSKLNDLRKCAVETTKLVKDFDGKHLKKLVISR